MTMIWFSLNYIAKGTCRVSVSLETTDARKRKGTHDLVELLHLVIHRQLLPPLEDLLVRIGEGLLRKRVHLAVLHESKRTE
jgi:hypothetical protein